ncbi:hypothetical protein [Flavobacterium sp.]|uniref:hypothetical protein n=1 Tax=Flavobacterium sp. TaxID=239 RepID=UPI003BDC03EF
MDGRFSPNLAARSRAKYRPFVGKSMTPLGPPGASQFFGGTNIFGTATKRGKRLAAGRKSCS